MRILTYREAMELMVGPCDRPGMRTDVPETEYDSDAERRAAWFEHGAELFKSSGWRSAWALERYGAPRGMAIN